MAITVEQLVRNLIISMKDGSISRDAVVLTASDFEWNSVTHLESVAIGQLYQPEGKNGMNDFKVVSAEYPYQDEGMEFEAELLSKRGMETRFDWCKALYSLDARTYC